MNSVISLLVILTISLIIIRVGTVALMLTGLSHAIARFQARSAFSGSGFTTSEAEHVLNHPVRREIILTLMLLGNVGIATIITSLILTFSNDGGGEGLMAQAWFKILIISGGLLGLWLIAYSDWIERRLNQVVGWALRRWTTLETQDYRGMLHLGHGYSVFEFQVGADCWMAGRRLDQMRLADEGILVLGVRPRAGEYVGAPRGSRAIRAGDTVVAYGTKEILVALEHRPAGAEGDRAHAEAVRRRDETVPRPPA